MTSLLAVLHGISGVPKKCILTCIIRGMQCMPLTNTLGSLKPTISSVFFISNSTQLEAELFFKRGSAQVICFSVDVRMVVQLLIARSLDKPTSSLDMLHFEPRVAGTNQPTFVANMGQRTPKRSQMA